jgi:hypothetical protein
MTTSVLRGLRMKTRLASLPSIALAAALSYPDAAFAGARLESATWIATDPLNAGAKLDAEGHTITTTLAGRKPGAEVSVGGRLHFDTTHGAQADLSFLTDVPWITCEAPRGLTADVEGNVDFVCQARARGLDTLEEPLRVYVKVDPTGGLAHKKLYWVIEPAPPGAAAP